MFKYIILLFLIINIVYSHDAAYAISEYGLKCEDNKDCIKCTKELPCMKCLNRCWNNYGSADSDLKDLSLRSKEESCRLKWAKWCSAQCWDPDEDIKKPDYVSSKPSCGDKSFFSMKGGVRKLKEKPNY